ncbi:MAG: dienelactone hydrolase family protein [Chromatocurvus sp.]
MISGRLTAGILSTLLTALAALPPLASADNHAGGVDIIYDVNGKGYEGYFANAEDSRGLVLLIHDWDGLTGYEKQRADMLANTGYSVFAVDLFGEGIRPEKVEDRRQHTGELYRDREKMRAIMQGALAAAGEQGADIGNAVAAGYCFGGAAVLELARSGASLRGFATFHGGLGTPQGQDYSQVMGDVRVYHGTADAAVTMSDFAALADRLEAHGVAHEMITYGGARHAFTVMGSERYQKAADEASWASFMAFLEEIL